LAGAVAAYVLIPLGLMVLLKFNNFFSGWMGSLGGRTQEGAFAISVVGF
jgi:hypothetical protein